MIEIVEANVDFELRLRKLVKAGQIDALDLLIMWFAFRGYKQKEIGEMLHTRREVVRNRRQRMRKLWQSNI
jgi:hypothetical protein